MQPITIQSLSKAFGRTVAVDGVDLTIPQGELFFLLGPSGCGKTTLLRLIAGFAEADRGTIHFAQRDVTDLPANRRNTGMVFQGYALWPHMNVWQNVAFGLDVRHVSAAEKKQKVNQALKSAQIASLAKRKPNELSGGQQQRVALARALVVEPTVLLLDEPLSNLDAKLRLEMRGHIRRICQNANITAVYVTHDQKEALSMADRIAVMRDGRVVQQGTPRELYEQPESRFVADFLGETNFLAAEITARTGEAVELNTPAGPMRSTRFPATLPKTGNVTCSIRPETLNLSADAPSNGDGTNHFTATPRDTVYLGEMAQHELEADGQVTVKAYELHPRLIQRGTETLHVTVDPEDVVILED